MQELKCNVIWHKNFTCSEWFEKILQKEFLKRREIAVDLLNGHYEQWNKETEILYPGNEGCDDVRYCKYIASKQNVILDQVNKKRIGLNLLSLTSNPDESCDIEAVLRSNRKLKMWFTIKLLEEN